MNNPIMNAAKKSTLLPQKGTCKHTRPSVGVQSDNFSDSLVLAVLIVLGFLGILIGLLSGFLFVNFGNQVLWSMLFVLTGAFGTIVKRYF
jgi:hypothetical protein